MQWAGAGARDSARLTSFQVLLMLLVLQPNLEKQGFALERGLIFLLLSQKVWVEGTLEQTISFLFF